MRGVKVGVGVGMTTSGTMDDMGISGFSMILALRRVLRRAGGGCLGRMRVREIGMRRETRGGNSSDNGERQDWDRQYKVEGKRNSNKRPCFLRLSVGVFRTFSGIFRPLAIELTLEPVTSP